ncbi:MAG TPA: MFS transporter [Ramlibacter sp.]|nr:MFS transporter [Ramlibacter sp.]
MSIFRYRAFVRFWVARVAGTAAAQMLMLAIGWQMYQLTGSAWDLGLVGLAQFAPSALVSLVAGHAADRFHRARLVLACYAIQGVVAALLLLATEGAWATRAVLLGLSLVLGALRPFQMASQQALLPALVPPDLLARAMALGAAGIQVAVIGGPAIAGLLFSGGLGLVYASCLGLFVAGSLVLLGVRYDHAPPPREPVSMATLLAGVRFIGANRVLLGAISLDLFAVLLGGATALLPIFAAEILKVGATGLGVLRSAPAVGALLTASALARWPLTRRVGRKLFVAVLIFGVCMIVFGLSRSFALSLVALAVSGAADMVSVIVRQTLVQLETPDAMRGRVAAVNTLFIGASNQLGEFESGATAALMGPVGSVVAGGVGTVLVAALWMRWFAALARRDGFREPADR